MPSFASNSLVAAKDLEEDFNDTLRRMTSIRTIAILDDCDPSDRFMPQAVLKLEEEFLPPNIRRNSKVPWLVFTMAVTATSVARLKISEFIVWHISAFS